MAKACKSVDVDVARDQAMSLLQRAESKVGAQSSCQLKLQTARSAIAAVDQLKETGLERRNGYIRATYHAGQALACATVEAIVPAGGKKRKAKAKAAAAPAADKPKRTRKAKAVAS